MTKSISARRLAIGAILTAAALVVTGCSQASTNGSQSAVSNDAEIRAQINNVSDLQDPHTITGVTDVPDFGAPTPVADNPVSQLPVELTDADGYDVTVTDTSRILALDLYGAYTKTLIGLGMKDKIVGRTVSSTEAELADLPLVTAGGHTLNVEAVLQLAPTLVIVDHSIGPREAIDQIRDAGVTVVVMEPTRTIDGVSEDIENVAGVVGLPEEGKILAERSVKDIDLDKEAIQKLVPENPLRIAFLYARGNGGVFFILGPESGTSELIEGVGGIDVAKENGIKDMTPANAEALAKVNPDVFIMMRKGLASTGGVEGLLQRPGVAQTVAGQNQRIITIDDGASLAYGPQTGELLLRTAQALYAPEQLEQS
ncbi:MAG: ABC transporter substrate-binding protein [Corynebacterium sp.]|nr:ABC transporter substrate-binding protein [Corynebacterium sp.]